MRAPIVTALLTLFVAQGACGQATPGEVSATADSCAAEDWPALNRYREENARLAPPGARESRVVFLGDSITEAWAHIPELFFPGKPYIGRGISGQTTPQMLLRFQQDVVALRPRAVVINGGTNDIAGNTGVATLAMIEDNLRSMTRLAAANDIRVVLASVTPTADYPWRPGLEPAEKIVALNAWMRSWCQHQGCVYADYFNALSDGQHAMKAGLSGDGVHPNEIGYALMQPIAAAAIRRALAPSPAATPRNTPQ
jgi:lysophospholipase L1-like esterase